MCINENTFSQNPNFKMKYEKNKSISINQNFSKTGSIFPFKEDEIFSLGVTGNVYLNADSSFVRIVLVDEYNVEYLVYETSKLFEANDTIILVDYADETAILDGIIPKELRIQIISAKIEIQSISINNKTKNKLKSANYAKLNKLGKEQRDSVKIAKLNERISIYGMEWLAGETWMSNLSYNEKRKLFMRETMPNINGFEYYKGGVFEVNPGAQDIEFRASENVVSAFDWRDMHGQNWNTSIKHQGSCGSCAIFTAVATVEALTNLFFNQHVDLDLAEQNGVSCITGNCSPNYWNPGRVLDYFTNTGFIDESCFPYQANDAIPCSDSCSTPNDRIRISGRIAFPSTGYPRTVETLQKMLIENGPMCSGIYSWGHAMSLVGFSTDDSDSSIVWIFKNSYGESYGENGYAKVKVPISDIGWTYAVLTPILSRNLNTSDIVCSDNDGDGYYFWGIGNKPAHCPPSNVLPDGDDSNADIGPMDGDGTFSKTLPYSFSFENNLSEWWQSNLDSINWSFCSGSTPSSNTGPSSAYDGSYYMYLEASNPNNPDKQAVLISPTFDLLNLCNISLSFYYHMYGANTGDLSLQVSTDGGDTWSSDIWNLSGNQENSWYKADVDLSSYSGQLIKVRFIGTTGNGYASDIAIDNFVISSTLSSTQSVTTTQTWSDYRSLCGHLIIQNGAKLTVSGTTVLPYQANITVKNNSELIVDNGNVINSNIIVESGGKLTLKNNGRIVQNSDETTINTGGLFDFYSGEIKIVKK